jgi:hypothetical protein
MDKKRTGWRMRGRSWPASRASSTEDHGAIRRYLYPTLTPLPPSSATICPLLQPVAAPSGAMRQAHPWRAVSPIDRSFKRGSAVARIECFGASMPESRPQTSRWQRRPESSLLCAPVLQCCVNAWVVGWCLGCGWVVKGGTMEWMASYVGESVFCSFGRVRAEE